MRPIQKAKLLRSGETLMGPPPESDILKWTDNKFVYSETFLDDESCDSYVETNIIGWRDALALCRNPWMS